VFFDVAIGKAEPRRITFELATDVTPKTCGEQHTPSQTDTRTDGLPRHGQPDQPRWSSSGCRSDHGVQGACGMNCIGVAHVLRFVFVGCFFVCFPENFRALCTGEKVRATLVCAQAEPAETERLIPAFRLRAGN
jgi:hypothetical protein